MSQTLSRLLGAGEPMFSVALQRLERASGNLGVDVRLTADIIARSHVAMRSLGLDPQDTHGEELYHALMALVGRHDEFLARRLGGEDPADVVDMLPRIRVAAQNIRLPRQAWVVKASVVKRMLREVPPKKAQKSLGYRSLESMLKREPVAAIYAAANIVESSSWRRAFLGRYESLQPRDFETKDVDVVYLESEKWQKLAKDYVISRHSNVIHLRELGVVVILPLPVKRLPGITITLMPRIIHYINEIRLYSAYFKLNQMKPDFGAVVVRTLTTDPHDHVEIAGQPLHWRIVHRRYANQAEALPELFDPHVRAEDLEWRMAEEVLFELEPALHFWHGLDYVGVLASDRAISFNLLDMAANYVNRLPYGHQAVQHMRQSLWDELYVRYIKQPTLETNVIRQLSNETVDPGLLAVSLRGRV
jgi:hypothetical protein